MASVSVMGGGIFGLSCAFALARRGARVRVFEAARVGAGASGGHVGALAPHAPDGWNAKKQFQLESLLMAGDFWAEVARLGGRDPLFARTGRVQPVTDPEALAARIDASRARWPEGMAMQLTEAPDGLVPDSPSGVWLVDGLTARIAPRAALPALMAALGVLGVEVVEGREHAPEGLTLWATGAAGLEDLGIGRGIRGQSALLAHDARDMPQVFADGLHIVPHGDGTVAVGSTTENDVPHGPPDALALGLVEKARAICPALAGAEVIDTWAGMRPRARTRAPVLGAWPGYPGHFVANGGFKIGFGMAPKVAEVMADLILEGRDAIPEGFRLHQTGTPTT